jgi:hypothetical protein
MQNLETIRELLEYPLPDLEAYWHMLSLEQRVVDPVDNLEGAQPVTLFSAA